MTDPIWIDLPGDSLKDSYSANAKRTLRLEKTSATNPRDALPDSKRQRRSDSLIQTPAQVLSLTPGISTYLGSRFKGSELVIEQSHGEMYSYPATTDQITMGRMATSWASARLKEVPRNLLEDIYAVLVLCHFHF